MKSKAVRTWFGYLLSSSAKASIRRFLGLQSFYILVLIAVTAVFFNITPTNVILLRDLAKFFFAIVALTILGTTASGVASIMKAAGSGMEDGISSYYQGGGDNGDDDKDKGEPGTNNVQKAWQQ